MFLKRSNPGFWRFKKMLSKGISPLDAILILWPEKISKDCFSLIETKILLEIRPKVENDLLREILEELNKRGSLSLWLDEYFSSFKEKGQFYLFAKERIESFLINPFKCKDVYLRLTQFSSILESFCQVERENKEKVESLENLINHCLREMVKGFSFNHWVLLIKESSSLLEKDRFNELVLTFEDSIDYAVLSYENLVWILNNSSRIKSFAIAELKRRECNY